MSTRSILIAAAACLAGFIAGFIFANSLNRSELARATMTEQPQAQNSAPGQVPGGPLLTAEEIRERVAAADRSPADFSFQRSLGLSLYRYASLRQDPSILPDAIRIMQRALDLDPADRDLLIGLGNAHYDVGYFNKDNKSFETAREFYLKALERVPRDVDVRTDLALSYFLQEPADLERAVAEFEKGLEIDPNHERSLQFLTQTYLKKNDVDKATETLERLKRVNPGHGAISELTTSIARSRGVN
ncbi:MAG: tetratricopeptide repeat protein [Pyrinomonadaceae bacterium]